MINYLWVSLFLIIILGRYPIKAPPIIEIVVLNLLHWISRVLYPSAYWDGLVNENSFSFQRKVLYLLLREYLVLKLWEWEWLKLGSMMLVILIFKPRITSLIVNLVIYLYVYYLCLGENDLSVREFISFRAVHITLITLLFSYQMI